MKLAVIGSRTFNNYSLLKTKLLAIHNRKTIELIVSGGANGADKLSERFAKEFSIPTLIHLPDWNKYGKGAGFIRNKLIVDDCDGVVAFIVNNSKGANHTVNIAKKNKKKTLVYNINQ